MRRDGMRWVLAGWGTPSYLVAHGVQPTQEETLYSTQIESTMHNSPWSAPKKPMPGTKGKPIHTKFHLQATHLIAGLPSAQPNCLKNQVMTRLSLCWHKSKPIQKNLMIDHFVQHHKKSCLLFRTGKQGLVGWNIYHIWVLVYTLLLIDEVSNLDQQCGVFITTCFICWMSSTWLISFMSK